LNETGNTSAAIDFDVPTTYDGQVSLRVSAPAGAFASTTANCSLAIVLSPVADSQMVSISALTPGIEATVDPCGKNNACSVSLLSLHNSNLWSPIFDFHPKKYSRVANRYLL
jgi:hypothetical protein